MKNQTQLPAKDYFSSSAVLTLTTPAPDNSSALDFMRRTEAQLGSCVDYGFPIGDDKGNAIRAICSTIGLPFQLPDDLRHPEATVNLLADLVQLGAVKTCHNEDGTTVYQWIPEIASKWRHVRFEKRTSNGEPRLIRSVDVSPSLSVQDANLAQSLSPRMFKRYNGGTSNVSVCYIPDLQGQLQKLQKAEKPDFKAWDTVKPRAIGVHAQNWYRNVLKTLSQQHIPLAIPIDAHVFVTSDSRRLGEVFDEAMAVDGGLGRYWYTPETDTTYFVPPKVPDQKGKNASKLEALLAA